MQPVRSLGASLATTKTWYYYGRISFAYGHSELPGNWFYLAPVCQEIMIALVRFCSCAHAFQDTLYGEGRRIFNHAPGNKGKAPKRYRCTACGREVEES